MKKTAPSIILFYLYVFVFFILSVRFFYLQINKNQFFDDKALGNSIRKITLSSNRGKIFDREGVVLVDNLPTFNLSIIPAGVNENFNYNIISKYLGISPNEIKDIISQNKHSLNKFRPILFKKHIDFSLRSKIAENKNYLPGLIFSEIPSRFYPQKSNLSHTLGYLRETDYSSKKNIGFSGLEKEYNNLLLGKDGYEYHLIDIYGSNHGLYHNPHFQSRVFPENGDSIKISILEKLQLFSEISLKEYKGAMVLMNAETGEIISYCSFPDYKLSSFVGPVPAEKWSEWNLSSDQPLLNRPIQGMYSPGSIFKLLTAIYVLENEIVNLDKTYYCNGTYRLGNRSFKCWKKEGHQSVNIHQAIVNSCNVYFYNLSHLISYNDFISFADSMGFGKKTFIDLDGEKEGLLPSKEYMDKKYGKGRWGKGNLLNLCIGQGDLLVTPIQISNFINFLSTNNLNVINPHFYKTRKNKLVYPHISDSTLNIIKKSMFDAVNAKGGTGLNAKSLRIQISGKTGTVQNPHGEDHAWFAGFGRYLDSTYSIVLIIEHGGKGSEIPSILAKKIFEFHKKIIDNNAS